MKKVIAIVLALMLMLGMTTAALAEKTVVKVWRHSGKPAEQTNILEQIAAFNASQAVLTSPHHSGWTHANLSVSRG